MAEEHARAPTPLLEWISAVLGAVLVASVLGTVLWDAVAGSSKPADVAAALEGVRATGSGYAADVRVENRGSEAAADVEVEGTLGPERRAFLIDYIPGTSRRYGTLVFTEEPRAGVLQLAVVGYRAP